MRFFCALCALILLLSSCSLLGEQDAGRTPALSDDLAFSDGGSQDDSASGTPDTVPPELRDRGGVLRVGVAATTWADPALIDEASKWMNKLATPGTSDYGDIGLDTLAELLTRQWNDFDLHLAGIRAQHMSAAGRDIRRHRLDKTRTAASKALDAAGVGDIDDDGDIDGFDWFVFGICADASGPLTGMPTGCTVFDFDSDSNIDLVDASGLQKESADLLSR